MKYVANGVVFVIIYIVFMVPTYILPYLGSNSLVAVSTAAAEKGVNLVTWLHLGSLVILMVITWLRSSYIDKKWLIIFPILATAFDFIPVLNYIPFVPTIMHLLAIILGVAGVKVASVTPNTE